MQVEPAQHRDSCPAVQYDQEPKCPNRLIKLQSRMDMRSKQGGKSSLRSSLPFVKEKATLITMKVPPLFRQLKPHCCLRSNLASDQQSAMIQHQMHPRALHSRHYEPQMV
jgi:hypothetical protein